MSQKYYFVAASRQFLCEEEPIAESLKERRKNYADRHKEIDFWLIENPAFLMTSSFSAERAQVPQPAAAIVSTDPQTIRWLKLRLEFVLTGEFTAPSAEIPDPLASFGSFSPKISDLPL